MERFFFPHASYGFDSNGVQTRSSKSNACIDPRGSSYQSSSFVCQKICYNSPMAEPKTKATKASVQEFLNKVEPEEKRQDSFALLEMFEKITGERAVMWGDSIVGFGQYHYKSERSRQEGDWMLVGFSPRKQNLTLYILHGNQDNPALEKLGKHKTSSGGMGGCLYINKLSDVDQKVLRKLIENSFQQMKKTTKQ
jgi:hypothetical protein